MKLSTLLTISLGALLSTSIVAAEPLIDNDGDGRHAGIDCNDNDPFWHDDCTLTAFLGCTDDNQREFDCLPNISSVELKLKALDEDLVGMNKDKHVWWDAFSRPGDSLPFDSKRHVQSIQYYGHGDDRYIITSLSDEHNDVGAAVQLIKTDKFGDEDGDYDFIVHQDVLGFHAEWARFNHPGGSQLVGNFLFLALEDFQTGGPPATGVWLVQRDGIVAQFLIPTLDAPPSSDNPLIPDHHQSTAAVTKLLDGTYLLAACVGPHGCDDINFYKSRGTDLLNPLDHEFATIDTWHRDELQNASTPYSGADWDECHPQNMNFVAGHDGEIYLVMFGALKTGPVPQLTCISGQGYDDHLFVYKLHMDQNFQIDLEFITNVDVIPETHVCARAIVPLTYKLHGLNFLAGSGLWLSPDGRDSIAILATEHYDSCGANQRPVNAKTRWGVSSNWNQLQLLTIDHPIVTVDEGSMAFNSGHFLDFGNVTLEATPGLVVPDSGTWNWSWQTTDGPDDTQTVQVTLQIPPFLHDTKTFDLVVNNVPPTAAAGLDQVVECAYGKRVELDATGSTDPGLDTLGFHWEFQSVPGSNTPLFDDPSSAMTSFAPSELGAYEAEVTVTDDDGASDSDSLIIVHEDTTPPTISSVTVTPDILWPPNGKMVPVEVNVLVTDSCDPAPACSISAISSNEPESRSGDSNITGQFTADLRAARLGFGAGRDYTIMVECLDVSGNSSTGTTSVNVPHDQARDRIK